MQELITRSETIERVAWRELYRRAPRRLRRALGLRAEDRGGVTFLSASGVDHLLLNRAIGLGNAVGPEESAAAEVVGYYERRGIDRYWIHLGSGYRYAALPRHLRSRGVVPYPRSWMKFARRAAPVEPAVCGFAIRVATDEDAPRISEIAAPCFDMPAEAGEIFTSAIGARGWSYLVAEDSGRVVAASALYARGRNALLVFAATAPEARRKGCQRALMAARLEEAQRRGCDHTFTETGMPVEGQPGSSYRNMLRAGFDELYVRDNFAPEGTCWQNQPSSDASVSSPASAEPSTTPLKAVAPSGT
jgi:GNAT superfamily N-acetyltransferase